MRAELISIGDELLIGQTINTNAAWLGMELSLIGISVNRCVVISDKENEIIQAFDQAFSTSDIIIVTGGLGPTKDDITKHVLCKYFGTELEINQTVLARIEEYFRSRKRPMLEANIQQAALPKKCVVLENLLGTASGMWFEKEGKVLISLPGVPYEMKGIMENIVFSRLKSHFKTSSIYHKSILLQGIGESFLAERMKKWENSIRKEGLGLAYLPSVGNLKLRITSINGEIDKEKIGSYFDQLKNELPQYVYGEDEDTLPLIVGKLLKQKKMTVGTVESCTGGSLAHSIVSISGSSEYFKGSLLTYSNELKLKLAHVNTSDLNTFGAVSKKVVEQMAENGRKVLGVDVCLSTSGIAGPDGGSLEKPVGTVWIGIATKTQVESYVFKFGDDRGRNIQLTVQTALNLLRCKLLEIEIEKK